MQEKHSAGDNILSYCTKCRLNLDHVVAAVNGVTIAKVKCKTCGGTHLFRDPSIPRKARTPRKKAAAAETVAVLWQTCLSRAKGKEHLYNMTLRYRVGDIVLHDKFGKGIVRKTDLNRCHVLFEDKERLMASAN